MEEGMGSDVGDKVYFRDNLGEKYPASQGYYGIIEDVTPARNYNMLATYQVTVYDKNDNKIRIVNTTWSNLTSKIVTKEDTLKEGGDIFTDIEDDIAYGSDTKQDAIEYLQEIIDFCQKKIAEIEDANYELDENEDHEVSMAQNSLKSIISSASQLISKLGDDERNIPGWIQDHITNAENYIDQANQGFHELEPSVKDIDTDTMDVVAEGSDNPEGDALVLRFLKGIAQKFNYPVSHAAMFVKERIKKLGY